jgi:hypothetical protein
LRRVFLRAVSFACTGQLCSNVNSANIPDSSGMWRGVCCFFLRQIRRQAGFSHTQYSFAPLHWRLHERSG